MWKQQYYQEQVKALADQAARDRDQGGDWDGRWQRLVDALAEAHDAARRLSAD